MRLLRILPVLGVILLLLTACGSGTSPGQAGDSSPAQAAGNAAADNSTGEPSGDPEGLVVTSSNASVDETTARLKTALSEKGLTVVATVDHAANARRAGLSLPPTRLVIFGNPKLGTPLMQSERSVAIDLPQKMLIWKGANGQVHVAYNDPGYVADRHGIEGRDKLVDKISQALDGLARTAAGNR